MSLAKISTLILDDNAHMRTLMRTILLSFEVRDVVEASDAVQAFEVLRARPIDIGFVDFRLGDLDGVEFCRMIRNASDSPNPFLPVIMITAYSERSRVMEAVNAGVDEFLVKPVRSIDVAGRINAVINRRRPFVRTPDFFGPDRRRKVSPNYKGPFRRSDDPGTMSI